MKKHYRNHDTCLNCGYVVDKHFCSNCGQENIEPKESFWHFLGHGISHYLHFDSKFFSTISPLITRPGFLTKEYIAGRRASHLGPLGLYLFISFIFFLVMPFRFENNKPKKADKGSEEQIIAKDSESEKDSLNDKVDKAKTSYDAYLRKQDSLPVEKRHSNLERSIAKQAFKLKNKENRDKFLIGLTSNASKVMFLLLPLFALILKLSFFRSKKYYLEHLIYSIHVHSFLFLMIIIFTLVGKTFRSETLSEILTMTGLLVILWYIYRSMRTVYQNSRFRTVIKLLILSIAYSFLFVLSLFIISLVTLFTAY